MLNLVPGNWFELKNINKEKIDSYDIDSFKKEILSQVNDRSEKLDFVDRTFLAKYPKAHIDEITFHLDNSKFKRLAKILESEKRHPIITFHGTTNLTIIKSILEHGYIIPGQQNEIIVKKKHGSAYGSGIYSSPFLDKSLFYTMPDNVKCVYVLINLQFLGTMKLIPPNGEYVDFKPPMQGVYPDGSNTRIVYGLEQVISADPQRVVPIAVIKINVE